MIGEKVDIKDIAKGDVDLFLTNKERKYSLEQMREWNEILKRKYPHMEETFLIQIIDHYSTHPHIFDDLVEDHKQDPDKFKVKPFNPDEDVKYPENWEEKLNKEE